MISIVTTTTVTTVTVLGLGASSALVAVVALLIFLVLKEALSAARDPRARMLNKVLNIAIIPLLVSFIFIATVMIVEVVG